MLSSSSRLLPITIVAVAVAVVLSGVGVRSQQLPAPAAKAAEKCQKAIKKAAVAFVGKKLKSLNACANGVLACVQVKPGDASCVTKARAKCTSELAKIAAEEEKLRAAIVKACTDDLTPAQLLSSDGLGYDGVAATCLSEFSTALTDVNSIAACVAAHHECRSEKLFEVQEPRARELIEFAGAALPATTCLVDYGGNGESLNDPKETGKAVVKCEKAIKKAGAVFTAKKLKSLQKCVDSIFTCVQTKAGDAGCLTKATGTCNKEFDKITTATGQVGPAIDKACAGIAFPTVSGASGANLTALASECAPFGVPAIGSLAAYEQCVVQQHECRVEQMLEATTPRMQELLGLGQVTLP